MSSTTPPPDPFANLIQGAKTAIRIEGEYATLAAKVKAGNATDEERNRLRFRPVSEIVQGGTVHLTTSRPLTVEEWKEMVARSRRGQTGPLIAPEEPKSE